MQELGAASSPACLCKSEADGTVCSSDNGSNAFLASVKLPGKCCSCMSRAAKFGARDFLLANAWTCCIAACANLTTCMLDVKAGFCGVCYKSLPSAVVTMSEERIEFCKYLVISCMWCHTHLACMLRDHSSCCWIANEQKAVFALIFAATK